MIVIIQHTTEHFIVSVSNELESWTDESWGSFIVAAWWRTEPTA